MKEPITTLPSKENKLQPKNTSENIQEDPGSNICRDDEIQTEITTNPFKHCINMTKWKWRRTYVLTVLLVPIRVILVFVTVFLAGLVSTLALFNLSEKEKKEKPIAPYWRKVAQEMVGSLGRAMICFCGVSVTVKGKIASADEAPIFVVAPHSTFFDAFALFWTRCLCHVTREENIKIPILGKCIELFQPIIVKREDPNSRRNTTKEIIRRTVLVNPDYKKNIDASQNMYSLPILNVPVSTADINLPIGKEQGLMYRLPIIQNSCPVYLQTLQSKMNTEICERWPQILFFPEGTNSNRKVLLPFKLGAFNPGKPVQPLLIRYPNRIDTVTWTWNQPHGAKSVLWTTLAQPFTRAELEFLPVYYPSSEEQNDPKLFATNVRNLMASSLKIPTSEMTFEEVKQRYAKLYKNKKLIKLKDKSE